MKRKTILSTLGMSFAHALGAVGALLFGGKAQVKAAEAGADVTESMKLYVVGSFNGWKTPIKVFCVFSEAASWVFVFIA